MPTAKPPPPATIRPSEAGLGWLLRGAPTVAPPPILQIRPLRYTAEGHPGALPPILGLRALAVGVAGAKAEQDPLTGMVLFQDLPPGARRFLLFDPDRRFLPVAVTIGIPARHATRPTMPASATPPAAPPRPTVLLRPAPGRAVPTGMTAVIGTLRDAGGHAIGLGALTVETVMEGRPATVTTWTAEDGTFAIWLPGEEHAATPPAPILRRYRLRRPTPALADALATDFFGALPADLDAAAVHQRHDLFQDAAATLIGPDGSASTAPPLHMPIRPARTQRWDLSLTG